MAKILVIDDEKPIRNSLCEVLEFDKHKVDLSEDGLKGLELIQQNTYDLVLCDIKMPKMDGMEMLEADSKLPPPLPPVIVMISGHGSIETAVQSLKLGAFDFLAKPIDLNRLLVTVRNALDRKNLTQETVVLKKKLSTFTSNEIIG